MPVDLEERVRLEVLLASAQRTADQSAQVDTHGFRGQMLVIDVTDYTDGTHDFTLQTSNDGSIPSEPAAALRSGDDAPIVEAASDTGIYYVSYIGSERYLHLDVAASGTTSGATYAVYAVKGAPDELPA